MSRAKPNRRAQAQVRKSQVVTTFGPGSLMDLPNHSVLVGGLDEWMGRGESISEPRLVDALRRFLNAPALALFAPPPANEEAGGPITGITAWQFPDWFITQDLTDFRGGLVRSRLLVHRRRLTQGKFIDEDRRKRPVVPIRFVRACRAGHIGDIDWYYFVHRGQKTCTGQLTIEERGTSGDITETIIRCDCGDNRRLVDALQVEQWALGRCDGRQLWLGPTAKEPCEEANRLLVRSASNAYFPRVMSVISLPDRDEALENAVEQVWDFLETVESAEDVARERRKAKVKAALDGFSDVDVFRAVQARLGATSEAPPKSIKQAEFEVLASCKLEAGTDALDGTFFARALSRPTWDCPQMEAVESVVLVHRLREVVAQVGFTRFEGANADVDGELDPGVTMAPLAREITWLPAVENRGEGVFLSFRKEAIDEWRKRPEVEEREGQLLAGFAEWKKAHPGYKDDFPGVPYIMLHSLSHLLITAVALECGYSASAIRERVYASKDGYGILLYTGTPDAEGTLGGLVEAGRQITRHVKAALERCRLCSNDPVCAQHLPANPLEKRYLAGAACHGCLLIAETSCEQFNNYLDRALVVPTVEDGDAAFFSR